MSEYLTLTGTKELVLVFFNNLVFVLRDTSRIDS